ncbi:phage holin family protein [Weissella tructae]
MSLNDMYLLGFLVIFAVGIDIIVGNLRASYEDKNNSSSGGKGILKKAIILTVTLAMMFLLYAVTSFAESGHLIAAVCTAYATVLAPLGYHEVQSILANVQMTFPDIHISDGINKFFNVKSEIKNKENK